MSSNKVATTSTQNIVPVQAEFDVNGNCLGLVGPGGVFFNPPISTDTITNSTITSSTINSTSIGATTPSTGAFTTLTANTLNLTNALGVAYGGTGLTTLTSGYIPYGNGTSAFSSSSNLQYSNSIGSGALSVGSSPNTGWNTFAFVQVNSQSSLAAYSNGDTRLTSNAYYNYGTWYYIGSSYATQYQQIGGSHAWYTAPSSTAGNAITFTQAMTLDTSGNLLVGKTTSSGNGDGAQLFPSGTMGLGHTSGTVTGTAYAAFGYAGGGIGSITQNGTTGVLYNTSSDQRLKTNIVDAPQGNIDQIKVRSFDWIADGSHQEYGMVAQELVEVAPYAVHQPTNPEEMMGVDYSKLVPMMIKEIQDLKAEVNQLKQKVGI